MKTISISDEAWEYAWDLKRKTKNTKSVGKIVSEVLLLNVKDETGEAEAQENFEN